MQAGLGLHEGQMEKEAGREKNSLMCY